MLLMANAAIEALAGRPRVSQLVVGHRCNPQIHASGDCLEIRRFRQAAMRLDRPPVRRKPAAQQV
jgi:hypothetical protein